MEGRTTQDNMERINFFIKKHEKKMLRILVLRSGETMSHWLRQGLRLLFEKEKVYVDNNTRGRGTKG